MNLTWIQKVCRISKDEYLHYGKHVTPPQHTEIHIQPLKKSSFVPITCNSAFSNGKHKCYSTDLSCPASLKHHCGIWPAVIALSCRKKCKSWSVFLRTNTERGIHWCFTHYHFGNEKETQAYLFTHTSSASQKIPSFTLLLIWRHTLVKEIQDMEWDIFKLTQSQQTCERSKKGDLDST